MTDTQLLVVPKSMPIIFPIIVCFLTYFQALCQTKGGEKMSAILKKHGKNQEKWQLRRHRADESAELAIKHFGN
jgi:hypothetical protein